MKRLTKKYEQCEKFTFTIEFQLELLRYLIRGPESPLVVPKIKPGYFSLIEHSIIMEGLSRFFRKNSRIPSEAILIEEVNKFIKNKDIVSLVTKEDIPNIKKVIHDIYANPLKDQDILLDNIYKYIAYVEMKDLSSHMDFSDFNKYEEYQNKIARILNDCKPQDKSKPLMMVRDTVQRQLLRKVNPDIVPTPYWQLNNLSNGGGYSKGSIFVLLDRPKAKKTFALINIARGYLAMKKNVLYIDLENGKNQIMERMVQSTLNKDKKQILSGTFDKVERRHMRKYKKLGVEFIVERVPALVGDCNTIKRIIQDLKAEHNIDIQILVIDFAAKLASISREKEDVDRINKVYIDLDNLASELGIEAIWTAQHITRDGSRHKETKYEDNDIASSISIVRNAQCILGLNSTQEEEDNNVQRLEVVVQRDGKPNGRCLFNINPDNQRWKEFTKEARAKYDETKGVLVDKMIKKEHGKFVKRSNSVADADRVKQTQGDIRVE